MFALTEMILSGNAHNMLVTKPYILLERRTADLTTSSWQRPAWERQGRRGEGRVRVSLLVQGLKKESAKGERGWVSGRISLPKP